MGYNMLKTKENDDTSSTVTRSGDDDIKNIIKINAVSMVTMFAPTGRRRTVTAARLGA
jgi:hypothetical protein